MDDYLDRLGEEILKGIKQSFSDKDLNDTRSAVNSLSYTVKGNSLIIEGIARVLFLEFGRSGGTMPPIDKLQGWVERKLGVAPEESRSVAFAVAKKIEKEGTNIFTDRSKGLQIEITLEMINKKFLEEFTDKLGAEITSGLFNLWTKGQPLNILQ